MVPRATVRTLKPKNLKTFLKNLRFLPALTLNDLFIFEMNLSFVLRETEEVQM